MWSALTGLTFLNPWALAGLAALPGLYFLLRVMPPAPRLVRFPAARFLQGLEPESKTPSHTPWWILLLRMLAAALLLLALAGPVTGPRETSGEDGALRLVVDNGWAAAQNWDGLVKEAEFHIAQAARREQPVTLLSTAPGPGKAATPPEESRPLPAGEALAALKGLKPRPWADDPAALAAFIEQDPRSMAFRGRTLWLSDGLQKPGTDRLARALAAAGGLNVKKPENRDLPLILKAPVTLRPDPSVRIDGPAGAGNGLPVTVRLLDERGRILDEKKTDFPARSQPAEIVFDDLPESLRGQAAAFRIAGYRGAQAVYLMDAAGGPKTVGILAGTESGQARPLTEDGFYLQKALEPYGRIVTGTLPEIMARTPSMIILPDIGDMPAGHLSALDEWARGGGLLLRFAGPNMTRDSRSVQLTPAPLRTGTRNLEGALSWDKPLRPAPFESDSPFYGLAVPPDVAVTGQLLPDIADTAAAQTWARLEDGTPLVTAAPYDSGLLVMVHTTAAPAWSNLALSGLYVEMLKRLLRLAGQGHSMESLGGGMAQPVKILDGFGAFEPPGAHVRPIDAAAFENTAPGPDHPPGLYGRGGLQKALNLGDGLDTPSVLKKPEAASALDTLGGAKERDLAPALLAAAMLILLADTLAVVAMASNLRLRRLSRAAGAALLLALLWSGPGAYAQTAGTPDDTAYAGGLYLAYIKTGDPAIDGQSRKGLEVLAAVLGARTSAEPQGVAEIDPARDELSFFPLLYWPLAAGQAPLPEAAAQNLQSYLDHGGTILIDTRGGDPGSGAGSSALRAALSGLNIPPLAPVPKDHVLTRAFYLLKSFPGRHDGPVWVEQQSVSGRDGVSSVIIGGNDWAGAWAETNPAGQASLRLGGPGTRAQETALRAGLNVAVYALTGNYKADQVHIPHILERLGRQRP